MAASVHPKKVLPGEARRRGRYAAGDVIASKYRLQSLLGEGGMGAVWAAKNLALDVDVAVKLLRVEVDTPEAAVRLLREARAAAQLKHPSIVQVYDFGETEHDDPFIVMEVLSGGSIADLLDRKGRLDAAHAVRLILPVASALAAAHDKGIVHRDLKPGNVVLAGSGEVVIPKVVDFGIAKLKNGEIDGCSTQTGAVLGSPDYMSPEQARGRSDVDERTDVWSLCVVLYEVMTGRRPFEADNYNALINAIIEEIPPPVTDFAAGDAELWTIIERGLEKAPDDRWPGMRDFGYALASWAVARGIDTDSSGTSLARVWLGEEHTPPPRHDGVASTPLPQTGANPGGRVTGQAPALPAREQTPPEPEPPTRPAVAQGEPPTDAPPPRLALASDLGGLGTADTLLLGQARRPWRSRWLALPAALLAVVLIMMELGSPGERHAHPAARSHPLEALPSPAPEPAKDAPTAAAAVASASAIGTAVASGSAPRPAPDKPAVPTADKPRKPRRTAPASMPMPPSQPDF
jgi:serine/threonine-protein kinase